jgi:hypothetical protein
MTRLFNFTILCVIILAGIFIFRTAPVASAPADQETPPDPNLSIADEYCLGCHGQYGQTLTLGDGSVLDLYVDPAEHAASIHGSNGYACVQCHTDVGEYPHPAFQAADRRNVTLQLNVVCQRCHITEQELTQDSVHAQAMAEGQTAAAICTDCHTAHAVQGWVDQETGETLPEARLAIPETCAWCHNAIYQEYRESVHGSALTDENNPDVPTCIDCHGVHNIEDPTTSQFRLDSPKLCGDCHSDPERMTKYGISSDVMSTYVADFHGTTVSIFEQLSPDAETNKPVCYDCHGVHNIQRTDDPVKGLQIKENLLATCQKCHPDAQENFPTAWLSHYTPSPDKYPIVYYVNLFYKFLIPTVLGGMGLLVVLDASRLFINWRRKSQETKEPSVEVPVPDQPLEEPAVESKPPVESGETQAIQEEPSSTADKTSTEETVND